MNTKKTVIAIVATIVFLVVLRFIITFISGYFQGMMLAKNSVPKVAISYLKEENVLTTIEAPARIEAKDTVNVIPKVSGTLQKRHVPDGAFVKKGQLIATIDQKSRIIAINSAKAGLQSAIAKAKKADLDFNRAKELLARDYIAKATYDESLANRDIAHANVAAQRAALADAERLYSYTMIRAEVSGKMGILKVVPGNYITPEGGPIVDIMSIDPIYVLYSLDSKRFYELRDDTIMPTVKQNRPIKMEIILPNGSIYKHDGYVDFYDNKISETTGTIELRATVKNPDNILIPGDFVNVKIYSNTPVKKLIIPQSAVLQDQSSQYVYTIDEKNRAKLTRIKTNGQYNKNWIVSEGLKQGDRYISKGLVAVRDSHPVKILTDEEIAEFEKIGKTLDDINENPNKNKSSKNKKSFSSKVGTKLKNVFKRVYYKIFIR